MKRIGKECFKQNYWNCVLAALLVTAVLGALSWISGGRELQEQVQAAAQGYSAYAEPMRVSFRANAGGLLTLLLGGPLTVGLNAFFIRNCCGDRDLTVTTPFSEAFKNYPRKLGGSLWMGLFIFLWSLLFVIPGIIKAISYSMTQYILADCPQVRAKDALKLSMRMMRGHKWEYFVMGLSFIGWAILTALTLGILGIFYTGPYMNSSFAVFYLEVRDEALRSGVVTAEQLEGIQPV